MSEQQIFAFGDLNTLQQVINLVRRPADLSREDRIGFSTDIIWAKITDRISDTEAKAIQVLRDKDGVFTDYENGLLWDSDEDQDEKNILPNLICFEGYKFPEVDQAVEAQYLALENEAVWIGIPPAAGGAEFDLIMLTGASVSGNNEEFQAQIIDNRIDKTPLQPITAYAPQLTAGTLPTSGDDVTRFWRAAPVSNADGIIDAYGLPDPPSTVYEFFPPIWF